MQGDQRLSSCHTKQTSLKLIEKKPIQTNLCGSPWKVARVKTTQCNTTVVLITARSRPRLYHHTLLCLYTFVLLIPAQFVHPACNFLYPPFLVLAWSRRLLYFLTMPADADCICISSDFLYLFLIVFLLVLPISLTWSRRLLHFPTSLIVMHHLTAGNQEKSARSLSKKIYRPNHMQLLLL